MQPTSFLQQPLFERDAKAERMGWMERWGVVHLRRLAQSSQFVPHGPTADEVRTRRHVTRQVNLATLWAALAGGLSAWGTVYAGQATLHEPMWVNQSWIWGSTIVLAVAEFFVLFHLSIQLVYYQASYAGFDPTNEDPLYAPDTISRLLTRAALEIPDPVVKLLKIDPYRRVSRGRLLLAGLLYKTKVIISNFLGRITLTQLLGKTVLRFLAIYASVPITAAWNAWVMLKIAHEARLRIFGRALAERLAYELKALPARLKENPLLGLVLYQAVGNAMVMAQRYHPNMLLLVVALQQVYELPEERLLDSWPDFLENLHLLTDEEKGLALNMLTLAAAMDGRMSPDEKQWLPQAFGSEARHYLKIIQKIRKRMILGQIEGALRVSGLSVGR